VEAFAIENGKPAQLAKSHAALTGSVRAHMHNAERSEALLPSPRMPTLYEMRLLSFPGRWLSTIAPWSRCGRRCVYGIVHTGLSGGAKKGAHSGRSVPRLSPIHRVRTKAVRRDWFIYLLSGAGRRRRGWRSRRCWRRGSRSRCPGTGDGVVRAVSPKNRMPIPKRTATPRRIGKKAPGNVVAAHSHAISHAGLVGVVIDLVAPFRSRISNSRVGRLFLEVPLIRVRRTSRPLGIDRDEHIAV